MKLVTEYLIIIDKDASSALYHLCDKVSEFNRLLQADPDIKIAKSKLSYRGMGEYGYAVTANRVAGKEQRFVHVTLTFDGEETAIEEFTQMLRAFRAVVHNAGGQPETLWDDVSLYYSYKAYPLIHKIENLMRKLITYFMLTKLGKGWVTEATPSVVRDAIDKSKRKQYLDVLHQVDFIHLGDFLFKAYQTKETSSLFESLEKAKMLEELNLEELKAYIGKSNWERYFSEIVDCTDEYLNKRWKLLYDLRCMVAHNALLNKSDYDKISQLVRELEEYLQKAIDNLDKVYVPEEDKEQVAEDAVGKISASYMEFIRLWKMYEKVLLQIPMPPGLPASRYRIPYERLRLLHRAGLVDIHFVREAQRLTQIRNYLVHDADLSLNEQDLQRAIVELQQLIIDLRSVEVDESSLQKALVERELLEAEMIRSHRQS